MSILVGFRASDNLLQVQGLQNASSLAYINDATITVTVFDSDGVEVSGETWPLSLAYTTDSDGDYSAVLQDTLVTVDGAAYYAEINIDGGGLQRYIKAPIVFYDDDLQGVSYADALTAARAGGVV